MGLFDDESQQQGQSPADNAIQNQINMNQAELEQKRKSLFDQRLDIIKSGGGTKWTPTAVKTPKPTNITSPQLFAGKPNEWSGILDQALGVAGQGLTGSVNQQR